MLKKITAFICSFLVIILGCSAAFFSSAAVSEVKLPFPEPTAFGGSASGAVCWYSFNPSSDNYSYYMAVVVPSTIEIDVNGGFNYYFTCTNNKVTCFLGTASNTVAGYVVYLFRWQGGSSYTCTAVHSGSLSASSNTTVTVRNAPSGSEFSDFQFYGNQLNSTSPSTTITKDYVFSGQFSLSELEPLFDDLSSDIGRVRTSVNNVKSSVDSLDSDMISGFSSTNNNLYTISLYCEDILNELRAEDYSEPPQPTENQQMSDYEEAEQAISDDAFNNLDNFEFEGIADSLGSFGNGFSGALSFLSSNMEFFTGNQATSYGSTDDDSAIRKLSVVILVVLSLGLVSFVLNLVSSKGSD